MNIRNKLHKITVSATALLLLLTSCGAGYTAELSAVGVRRDPTVPAVESESTETNEEPIDDPVAMSKVICIDPGHGFDDPGCSSEFLGGLNEDDINLVIAKFLDEELRALGYQTIMTHDGETFPITSAYDNNNKFKPQERTAYAETLDIDYYVSIHCNSFDDPSANGIGVYYYDGFNKVERTSGAIAEAINEGILDTLDVGTVSKVIEMTSGAFHVIRETTVPASLIEVGFVTNEADAANLVDEVWQRAFAKGVAKGIDSYYKRSGF